MVYKPNGIHYKLYSNSLVQLFKTKWIRRIGHIKKYKIGTMVKWLMFLMDFQ